MKMFLTRMGKNAKFISTRDPGQVELPRNAISGIKEAIMILKNTPGVGIVHLDESDVIRNKLVKKIVDAYKNIENNNEYVKYPNKFKFQFFFSRESVSRKS